MQAHAQQCKVAGHWLTLPESQSDGDTLQSSMKSSISVKDVMKDVTLSFKQDASKTGIGEIIDSLGHMARVDI